MSWQVNLALACYAGWLWLHSWLGKKRFIKALTGLIALEVLGFVGFASWTMAQDHDISASGAAGLALFVGTGLLLVPALVGAYSIWKFRAATNL